MRAVQPDRWHTEPSRGGHGIGRVYFDPRNRAFNRVTAARLKEFQVRGIIQQ